MTTHLITKLPLVLLLAVCPAGLSAQEDEERSGLGAVLDFIHRLSGPQFFGPGASVYVLVAPETYVRFTGVARKAVDRDPNEVMQTDAKITMSTLQATLEKALYRSHDVGSVDLGVGVGFHRFGGDVTEFWHESGLIQAQWYRRIYRLIDVRLGAALHAFPPFDDADFAPLTVHVSRTGYEAVGQFFLGLDFRW